jgi:hypothetical protein
MRTAPDRAFDGVRRNPQPGSRAAIETLLLLFHHQPGAEIEESEAVADEAARK